MFAGDGIGAEKHVVGSEEMRAGRPVRTVATLCTLVLCEWPDHRLLSVDLGLSEVAGVLLLAPDLQPSCGMDHG